MPQYCLNTDPTVLSLAVQTGINLSCMSNVMLTSSATGARTQGMETLRVAVKSRRRCGTAAACVVALLLLSATLTACDPSADGCRRVSSFLYGSQVALKRDTGVATFRMPNLEVRPEKREDERRFNCTKQESPQWNKLKRHKGSIRTNGKSGKRAEYYEWDATHNDIEIYGPAPGYKHLGSMDPITGREYKPAVKGRNLRDELK